MNKYLKIIPLSLGVLILSIFVGYLVYAFGPTAPFPGGNVDAPLNVGTSWQVKQGGIALNAGGHQAAGLLVEQGDVGIGIIAPTARLHVAGNAQVDGTVISHNINTGIGVTEVHLMNQNVRTTDSPTFVNLNSISQIHGDFGNIARSTDEWLRLNHGATHTNGIYIPNLLRTDGAFQVGPSGNRFIVNTAGNVGIGTTAPAQRLHVAGNALSTGFVRADGGFQVDGHWVIGSTGWTVGDRIQQNTVDGSEIQDGTIGSADLATTACELVCFTRCDAHTVECPFGYLLTSCCVDSDFEGNGCRWIGNFHIICVRCCRIRC